MKNCIPLALLALLFSCNLKESIDHIKQINTDLSETFEHKNLNTAIGWGDDAEDNYVQLTFYEYDMKSKSYEDLQELANQVIKKIKDKYPDLKEKEIIEVRFTDLKKDDDENENFVTFKQKKNH